MNAYGKPTLITSTVAEVAKAAGFKKAGSTWHREVPLGVQVLGVQKSQWGGQYYLNLGIYVRDLGTLPRPPAHKCHFNTRATTLDAGQARRWDQVLNLDEPITEEERKREVTTLLTQAVLPFLDDVSTIDGLRAAFKRGDLERGLLMVELKSMMRRA